MASILWIGTHDPGFPRNKKLARLLELGGHQVSGVTIPVWGDERYELPTRLTLRLALRAAVAYLRLLWAAVTAPRPDLALVSYPGWFDAVLLGTVLRLRRVPVLFDVFISLSDTVVSDRRLAPEGSVMHRLTVAADRAALRRATRVLADTPDHAEFFSRLSGIGRDRIDVVELGADDGVFGPHPEVEVVEGRVLFHGTFIGLQGVDTIIRAAKELDGSGITFRVVGSGQEQPTVDRLMAELAPANVELTGRVPLDEVPLQIAAAAVCLGIFGTSDKAHRVVPNKLFECLAVGRPVVTADTPAVASVLDAGTVVTSPPGDPAALARTVAELMGDRRRREEVASAGHRLYHDRFHEQALAARLEAAVARTLSG